jgi:hypothetical protein
MESARDTLVKRLEELKARRYEVMRKAGEPLAYEMKLIEKMIQVYDDAKGEVSSRTSFTGDLFSGQGLGKSPREITKSLGKTTQEMVLEILKEVPDGMSALELLSEVNRRWELGLIRTSLSPQISRLRAKGLLQYDSGKWKLSAPSLTGKQFKRQRRAIS